LISVACGPTPSAAAPPAVILHVLIDDLGWADVGWHRNSTNNQETPTPHMTTLAAGGGCGHFENASCTECAPRCGYTVKAASPALVSARCASLLACCVRGALLVVWTLAALVHGPTKCCRCAAKSAHGSLHVHPITELLPVRPPASARAADAGQPGPAQLRCAPEYDVRSVVATRGVMWWREGARSENETCVGWYRTLKLTSTRHASPWFPSGPKAEAPVPDTRGWQVGHGHGDIQPHTRGPGLRQQPHLLRTQGGVVWCSVGFSVGLSVVRLKGPTAPLRVCSLSHPSPLTPPLTCFRLRWTTGSKPSCSLPV
jgi:hypothetical protein